MNSMKLYYIQYRLPFWCVLSGAIWSMKSDIIVELTQSLLASMVIGTQMWHFVLGKTPPYELSFLTFGIVCFYFGRSVFMGKDAIDIDTRKRLDQLEQDNEERKHEDRKIVVSR